jgi:hypothetical protein
VGVINNKNLKINKELEFGAIISFCGATAQVEPRPTTIVRVL